MQGQAMMGSQFLPTNDLFIADDDMATCEALSLVFTLAGYRVSVFADAETFLAAARSHPPAGVLLDLQLSDMSGLPYSRTSKRSIIPRPFSSYPAMAILLAQSRR
jgi:DNA-binding response OmpR family regulator